MDMYKQHFKEDSISLALFEIFQLLFRKYNNTKTGTRTLHWQALFHITLHKSQVHRTGRYSTSGMRRVVYVIKS